MFDCAVIGGGPAGYRTAEMLGKKGMHVILMEKENLGGACLNEGCIPFKSYLHVASLSDKISRLVKTGVMTDEESEFSIKKLRDMKEAIVRGLKQSVSMTLEKCGVEIRYALVSSICKTERGFEIKAGDELIEAKKIVLALGSKAASPEITCGHTDYRVLGSRDVLEMDSLPEQIDIIGAGAIGLESASFFADMGSRVTLIEAVSHIGGQIDHEISEALKRVLERKGIEVLTDTRFSRFEADGVLYEANGDSFKRDTKTVLYATGRRPNTDSGLLSDLDVSYSAKGIEIDSHCETSVPGVYACGDVTGKNMLAHTAFYQAMIIAENMCGAPVEADFSGLPRVIYSNPEVLSVGETAEDCVRRGIEFRQSCLPMTYSGRYFAENGKDGAKAKLIVDGDNTILGFHMIGNGASEIALAAEMMVREKKTLSDIKNLIYAHPTYGEIIYDLACSL